METYRNADAPLDVRVADLMGRLTLQEKVRLLAGASHFNLHAIERLGVPSLSVTDGPTGVRSLRGEIATVFPVGVALAATWNPETARNVAGAIAREALAHGDQVVLAPTINIMRIPHWGRNFESYSEDPHLTARIGVAYVQGLQAEGVGASLKHYAANNQELERFEVDVRVDERTLREIYLAAFEAVVKEADPWTVMASYNKIGGVYASEHRRLLTTILKEEWGYEGMVVSDWNAVKATTAAAAGLDLEMPGPERWFGDKLMASVERGDVLESQIEDNVRRVIRLIVRSGLLDGPRPAGELRTPRHAAIACDAAAEAMTLLKNEAEMLPLSPQMRRVALIGPNAVRCQLQGGVSSKVVTGRTTSLLEAFRARLGPKVEVHLAQGVDSEPYPPIPAPWLFSPDETRSGEGLEAQYYAEPGCGGALLATVAERAFVRRVSANIAGADRPTYASFRWAGWFWPERSGDYEFGLRATGEATLTLEDEALITPSMPATPDHYDVLGRIVPRRLARTRLEAGRGYRIVVEYTPLSEGHEYIGLGVRDPAESIEHAISLARSADAVVLVLGSASITEAEGYDRVNLTLPGAQDELARHVLGANPNTIVVINTGSPVAMPWIEDAPAVLQMWLPGETGPQALAEVVFGDREPGGRLPMSFPARFGDHPAHAVSSDPLTCDYSEALAVGYRHYDAIEAAPLFPFGHGHAYTSFHYGVLDAPDQATAGQPFAVEIEVANTGERTGDEVVQLYVAPRTPRLPRPPKELKAFAKVRLAPGERRTVRLELGEKAFAVWDVEAKGWVVDPGAYDLLVGRSAGDIRAASTVRVVR
ncbi:MAG TPA: glycoside hydrolase family 3 C-terminal domain-containing protein [Caulobacteraceae bacterium]|jgi:beta-glucosidase